ncbi:hypothetical protein M0802_012661 [Mischocyttarus mexicanus]|nr:hypothetical protein M0802_012661 [Mischocyttarus mexicanus]
MAGIFEILAGVTIIGILLYYYLTSTFNFWKSRGVKGPEPIPIFGNIKDLMLQQKTMPEFLIDLCNKYRNEPYIGVFFRSTPILILTDPQLLKDIMIKDFSSFSQRGTAVTEKAEPLSQHLLFLDTARWRPLRNKLSPAFTSGKLKEMFPLIIECSQHLKEYLDKMPENEFVEIRELTAKFTTDVIGNCAFGIEMNALTDEDSEFRRMGRKIFKMTLGKLFKFRLRESFPTLYNELGFLFHDTYQTSFFVNIVKETMEHRIKNNIVRHDFINILKELKDDPTKLSEDIELTDTMCAAQAFVFFAAGFETSSTTMSNALYELAQNHEIQDKVRQEIHEELEKNNGILKYEMIKKMSYLHAVFQETLRKYPPGMILFRECLPQSYTFEGTKLTIPKKQKILIPVVAIHRNPEIYPKPDVFDPERFLNEDNSINETTYLPFGRGPRNCIGERFAVVQTKVGLITFLRNYEVDVCEKTEIPYPFSPSAFMLQPKNGIYLKFTSYCNQTVYFKMLGIFEILCSIVGIILFCYYYSTATFDFWKVRGVKGPKPIPLFGNAKNLILRNAPSARYIIEICNLYKNEPYIGIFYKRTPILILKDPLLVNDVMIKDFSSFPQRGAPMAVEVEPLSQHIVLLEAERWRPLRAKLSASFSTGKLKDMFHLIRECSENLEQYLNKIPDNSNVDVYDIAAKFTIDMVGNCIFGIKMNALTDEQSEFCLMGKEIFKNSWKNLIKFRLREAFPNFYNKLSFLMHDTKETSFFINLVEEIIQHRIKNNIVRHDFINILKELKENPKKLGIEFELTDVLCAAQAYVFFGAGYETSSLTISHALYELAQHHDIQDKLREEIREEFEKNGGTVIFESINTMKYLHAVYQETLRKYPTGMIIYRECTAPCYTFEKTKLTIPKNQKILIPVIAMHHNPDIYPNPDIFDPERFLIENNLINETTYLPFGKGPRNCIGARLAVFQTKIGLATFLRNHKVDLCEKTDIPYSFGQSTFLFTPKNGIYLKISQFHKD